MNTINSKLKSVELCLSAHPDNEEHSEFADRISDIQEIQKEVQNLIEWKESATKIFNEIGAATRVFCPADKRVISNIIKELK